uniref:Uncharacterized protein n=1 Tax=Melanopsichium pennsylvanicum 4 TaxID=1398559 RepID=A0A077RDT8_9BASI|nr:uncharacterized protein BN887_06242 [Melanopsichium pennsylvanicum 4]
MARDPNNHSTRAMGKVLNVGDVKITGGPRANGGYCKKIVARDVYAWNFKGMRDGRASKYSHLNYTAIIQTNAPVSQVI